MRAHVFLALAIATACADARPEVLSGGDGCDERGGPDGGSSSSADAGPVLAQPSGGYLKLARFTSGGEQNLLALAELDTGHTGPGRLPSTFYQRFPIDTCFQVPLLPAEPSSYDFVDIGDSIQLDGPASIVLEREILLGTIYYQARGLSDIAPGDYAVSLPGGTLRMPPAPQLLEPDLASGSVLFGSPIALRWQPVGADHLFFIVQQDSIGRVCHLADDGAFELPAEAAAGTPSWGTAVFMAVDRVVVAHDGRDVELVGVQAQVADYERE